MSPHEHSDASPWEAVIGLEIHVELNTVSKLFSDALNRFGDAPNTNVGPVCLGLPGALPVLNEEAVKKAVQFGCAIEGEVALYSRFDRKSYFYPDSPCNYQKTQYYHPIVKGGRVLTDLGGVEKVFYVNRVHLEDDAGMLKHFSSFAGVDYNRAGAPLIEIVSEPCIHTPKEASAYAKMIKSILEHLDISDCNMEEGSFRMDTNISVRRKGETTLRNKVEIKNINSFSFMELAIQFEMERQIALYEAAPNAPKDQVVRSSTLRWDQEQKCTVLMRDKETAEDYRYFPEPDLPPIILTEEFVAATKRSLPELPFARENRYLREHKLSKEQATQLVDKKALADYFDQGAMVTTNRKALANWILVEFAGRFRDTGSHLISSGIPATSVAELVNLIDQGKITGKMAKGIADEMVLSPAKAPSAIIADNPDYQPISDSASIEQYVEEVLRANPQSVRDYLAGREKAFAFLVGQVMAKCKGKAAPQLVNELIKKKIHATSQ